MLIFYLFLGYIFIRAKASYSLVIEDKPWGAMKTPSTAKSCETSSNYTGKPHFLRLCMDAVAMNDLTDSEGV